MTLKVIGAGYGRTGTLSLKHALEELGFGPCYHMEEVIKRPFGYRIWQKIADGVAPDWDSVFDGYQATVDWPGCNYYQELMAKYPKAKVVLTVRDPDRWHESSLQTIYAAAQIETRHLPFIAGNLHMARTLIWNDTFNGRFAEREYAIQKFNDHIEAVKQTVPPEKLLVFNVKEGWQPLCDFLGVPVPERPFPHVNDRTVMENRLKRVGVISKTAPLFFAIGLLLTGLLISHLFRSK